MQTYDIIMLVVLAAATIFGAIKGFAWQVASLASIVVSYFVASYFRNDVAQVINAQPPWNMFLAMLLLYFGTSLAIWLLFRMISSSIDKIRLKEFDRQLGAGFGLIKGAVLCCLITMFAMTLLGPTQQQSIANSRSGHYIGQVLSQAGGVLPAEVKEVIGPVLANVGKQLEQSRDPNYNQPVAPGLPGGDDPWSKGLDAAVNAWGQEMTGGGQAPAGGRNTSGGILSRWLNPNNTPAPSNPPPAAPLPGNPNPGNVPGGLYPPGYPASFPSTGGNLNPGYNP